MPLSVEKCRQQNQEYSEEWLINKDPDKLVEILKRKRKTFEEG